LFAKVHNGNNNGFKNLEAIVKDQGQTIYSKLCKICGAKEGFNFISQSGTFID